MARLNDYLDKMTSLIFHFGGTLDKYLGDGLMAVFGAPLTLEQHAACALEMQQEIDKLNEKWAEKEEQLFRIGVRINTGEVLVGNVGGHERMDYTVTGKNVNLASKLEGLTKEYGTDIIISGQTWEKLKESKFNDVESTDLGEVQVRGLARPVRIYGLHIQSNKETERKTKTE